MPSLLFSMLILASFVFSCAPASSPSTLSADTSIAPNFDVNDVSILFPIPRNTLDLRQLASLDEGTFINTENFATLLETVSPKDDPNFQFYRRGDWQIIGMRFDPCFQAQPGQGECTAYMRLIAQPLVPRSNIVLATDHALHLLYRLNSEESRLVAHELYRLKEENGATNGVPLQFHPTMAQQGLQGAFANGVRALIRQTAREERLEEATAMLSAFITQWRFGKTLMQNGRLSAASIPLVDSAFEVLAARIPEGSNVLRNQIVPVPTGTEHAAIITDSLPRGGFFALDDSSQKSATDVALRIDNPLMHSPATMDCVSCHMASRGLTRVYGREFLSAKDDNPNRFTPADGVTITNITSANELKHSYATRAFGYSFVRGGQEPGITQRTVNDSARIADWLNRNFSNL